MLDIEKEFLTYFFKILNKNNVKYVVLRNYDKLPFTLDGSDLDIMVSKEHIELFYRLLKTEILVKFDGKIISQYGYICPKLCILLYKKEKWYGIQIDLFNGILPYKANEMYNAEELILNREVNKYGVCCAGKEDNLLISFLKEILNNKRCNEKKYFIPVQNLYLASGKEILKKLEENYSNEFIEYFKRVMKESYSEKAIGRLALLGRKSVSKSLKCKIRNLVLDLNKLKRCFNPPGFSIALLGCDGSGKTTIIERIWGPLEQAMHRKIKYEHMRPNMIPNIAQLFGKAKSSAPTSNPHASKQVGFIMSTVRFFYYVFDYIAGYWSKTYTLMVKDSCIIIFDRYYYDYYLDQKRSRIRLPQALIKLIDFFVPKPDIVFCLGAEPENIQKRKPELSLSEIKRQVITLKSLTKKNSNMFWIDTGNTIDESVEQVFLLIKKYMAERYAGK